jgi:hypothetical protein
MVENTVRPLRRKINDFLVHPHRRAAAYVLAAILAGLACWRLLEMMR